MSDVYEELEERGKEIDRLRAELAAMKEQRVRISNLASHNLDERERLLKDNAALSEAIDGLIKDREYFEQVAQKKGDDLDMALEALRLIAAGDMESGQTTGPMKQYQMQNVARAVIAQIESRKKA